jgi:starch phosphorylase
METAWRKVSLEAEVPQILELDRGQEMKFEVRARLGTLKPEQVRVEVFAGRVRQGEIAQPQQVELACQGSQDGTHRYQGVLRPQQTGNFGFGVRVTPVHPDLPSASEVGLVYWAR